MVHYSRLRGGVNITHPSNRLSCDCADAQIHAKLNAEFPAAIPVVTQAPILSASLHAAHHMTMISLAPDKEFLVYILAVLVNSFPPIKLNSLPHIHSAPFSTVKASRGNGGTDHFPYVDRLLSILGLRRESAWV